MLRELKEVFFDASPPNNLYRRKNKWTVYSAVILLLIIGVTGYALAGLGNGSGVLPSKGKTSITTTADNYHGTLSSNPLTALTNTYRALQSSAPAEVANSEQLSISGLNNGSPLATFSGNGEFDFKRQEGIINISVSSQGSTPAQNSKTACLDSNIYVSVTPGSLPSQAPNEPYANIQPSDLDSQQSGFASIFALLADPAILMEATSFVSDSPKFDGQSEAGGQPIDIYTYNVNVPGLLASTGISAFTRSFFDIVSQDQLQVKAGLDFTGRVRVLGTQITLLNTPRSSSASTTSSAPAGLNFALNLGVTEQIDYFGTTLPRLAKSQFPSMSWATYTYWQNLKNNQKNSTTTSAASTSTSSTSTS